MWSSKVVSALFIIVLLAMTCVSYSLFYRQFDLGGRFLYLHISVSGTIVFIALVLAAIMNRFVAWILPAILIVFANFNYAIQSVAAKLLGHTVSFEFMRDNWPIIGKVITPAQSFGILGAFLAASIIVCCMLNYIAQKTEWRYLIVLPLFFITISPVLAYIHSERVLSLLQWEPTLAIVGYKPKDYYFGTDIELAQKEAASLRSYHPTQNAKAKHIVVFMAESLNPDYIGQFGYQRDTLPILSKVRSDFEFSTLSIGRSTCAESICAVTSFLASRPLSQFPSIDAFTITEALRRNGYKINFILASDHKNYLHGFYGEFIEKQADFLYDFSNSAHPINSDEIVIDGLKALPNDPVDPTFTFVFFFTSHIIGEVRGSHGEFGPFKTFRFDEIEPDQKMDFTEKEQNEWEDSYSSRLRELNHYMAKSYDILGQKGYLDNTDFFLLSDHGEDVAQRGRLVHGHLTEGGLRIPFLWASNQPIGAIDRKLFTQIDFAPTLADRINIDAPAVWRGVSLLSPEQPKFTYHENGNHKFVLGVDCKAVYGPLLDKASAKYINCVTPNLEQSNEFFDIDADYFEENNLWQALDVSQQSTLRRLLERMSSEGTAIVTQ